MTSEDSLDIREVIFINERCRVDSESMPVYAKARIKLSTLCKTPDRCRLSCVSHSMPNSRASLKSGSHMTTTLTGFTSL
jgi:hypothetical protein